MACDVKDRSAEGVLPITQISQPPQLLDWDSNGRPVSVLLQAFFAAVGAAEIAEPPESSSQKRLHLACRLR